MAEKLSRRAAGTPDRRPPPPTRGRKGAGVGKICCTLRLAAVGSGGWSVYGLVAVLNLGLLALWRRAVVRPWAGVWSGPAAACGMVRSCCQGARPRRRQGAA